MHFNGWVIFHVFVYHNFFISSSVDGHLGCFHILAIVNSPAVNTEGHVSFWVTVFSRCIPSSGIAGSSFPVWIPFISSSSLLSVVRTSKTMLNKTGDSGHPFLVPELLNGNSFRFSPLSKWRYCRFFTYGLYCVPLVPTFWTVYQMLAEFFQRHFCTYWDDHIYGFYSVC